MADSVTLPTGGPAEVVITCMACWKTYRYIVTGMHLVDDGEHHVYTTVTCDCGQRIGYFLLGDEPSGGDA